MSRTQIHHYRAKLQISSRDGSGAMEEVVLREGHGRRLFLEADATIKRVLLGDPEAPLGTERDVTIEVTA